MNEKNWLTTLLCVRELEPEKASEIIESKLCSLAMRTPRHIHALSVFPEQLLTVKH